MSTDGKKNLPATRLLLKNFFFIINFEYIFESTSTGQKLKNIFSLELNEEKNKKNIFRPIKSTFNHLTAVSYLKISNSIIICESEKLSAKYMVKLINKLIGSTIIKARQPSSQLLQKKFFKVQKNLFLFPISIIKELIILAEKSKMKKFTYERV